MVFFSGDERKNYIRIMTTKIYYGKHVPNANLLVGVCLYKSAGLGRVRYFAQRRSIGSEA